MCDSAILLDTLKSGHVPFFHRGGRSMMASRSSKALRGHSEKKQWIDDGGRFLMTVCGHFPEDFVADGEHVVAYGDGMCSFLARTTNTLEGDPEGSHCPIFNCCVIEKELTHCGQCEDFPCSMFLKRECPTLSKDKDEQLKDKAISRLRFRANVHEPKHMHYDNYHIDASIII